MVKQHIVEILQGARTRVTFQVAADDTASEYRKIVQKYAKDIELKGFRKGKVPRDLLERKFGKEFHSEAFHEILNECTKEVLPDLEPQPLGFSQPCLCDASGEKLEDEATSALIAQFQPGQPLEFAVAFDVAPSIPLASLDGLDGLNFETVEVDIADKDIDQEIEQLREQNGVMVERKDGAGTEGDILSMRYALLEDGQSEPTDDDATLRTIVRIGEEDAHGFEARVKELKNGDVLILEEHSFPDEARVEEQLRGKTSRVWLEVTSIRTRELPELDDDFAQDIDEAYETLDDLRKATGDKLRHDAEHVRENYGLLQIYQHWIDQLDFAIPRSMVAYQTQSVMDNIKQRMGNNEQGLMMYLAMQHDGDVQKGMQALEKEAMLGLFVDLVREKLLKSKGWQATDEDIDKELKHMAAHQNTTVEKLKGQYEDRWEQVKDYFGQTALSSRLSKELVAEVCQMAGEGQGTKLGVTELKEKLSALEQSCQDAVYLKFSPFAKEGGLIQVPETEEN